MSDDLGVILNEQEYEKLKQQQNIAKSLSEQVHQLKQILLQKQKNIQQRKIQLYSKDLQISCLIQMIERLSKKTKVEYLACIVSSMEGSIYEDIDQFQPEKHVQNSALFKDIKEKYSNQAQIIESSIEKYKSQQFLLRELQGNHQQKKTRAVKNQLINNIKNQQIHKTEQNLFLKNNEQKQIRQKTGEDQLLKKAAQTQLIKKSAQDQLIKKLSSQAGIQFENVNVVIKHIKDLLTLNNDYKFQLEAYKKMLKDCKSKTETLEIQLSKAIVSEKNLINRLKTIEKAKKTAKGKDQLYNLKLNIDQYIRGIQLELKEVEGLHQNQKKKVLEGQLKVIIEYIEKSVNK